MIITRVSGQSKNVQTGLLARYAIYPHLTEAWSSK